jgi:hypothetical protein
MGLGRVPVLMWLVKDLRDGCDDQYISLWQPIPLDVAWRKVELVPVTWRVRVSRNAHDATVWV